MARRNNYENWIGFLPKSRSVIEITNSSNTTRTKNKGTKSGYSFEKFGSDDKLPDEILKAVWENDFMPALLEKAVYFLHGTGLGIFQKRIVPGTENVPATTIIEPVENPEISAWMKKVNLKKYWLKACTQFIHGANAYTGFNLNVFGQPLELNIYDWPTMRAEIRNEETGQIENYILFGERKVKEDSVKAQLIPRYYTGIEKHEPQFVYHVAMPTPGQQTYGLASWFGALETIKVLNKIPKFHSSGLDNGYNVKYHVKIPAAWLDLHGERNSEARKKAWDELQQRMDDTLSGVDNVNKALITEFIIDPATGRPLPGVEVIALDGFPTDKTYLELSRDFRINAASSVGIHPGIANVDTGGKLGGSASEMRVAADLHTALCTPIPRMLLLEPINIAMRMMGFDEKYFIQPIDFKLETLDKNPTGQRTVTNNANAPA
jgi:hypothetical protein